MTATNDPAAIKVADVTNIIGKPAWLDAFRTDASLESFFTPTMRGAPGSGRFIVTKEVPGGVAGTAVDIPLLSGLLGSGVSGESVLAGNEELIANSHQAVTPDFHRHGVATNKKSKWSSAVELIGFVAKALATWAGGKQDALIWSKILATTKRIFGGDATTRATVGSNDTFTTVELSRGKLALQRMGAMPVRTETDAQGRKVNFYACIVSALAQASLQADVVWQSGHRHIAELADKNPLYSGALGEWNGMIVYPYNELAGSGSALRPEATLTANITDSVTTIGVGGGKTGVNYTDNFPTAGTLLIGSEQITYTGKTATTFTGCTRGANSTVAAAHTAAALVTLNNLCFAVFMGAEAIAEAEGQKPTPVAQSSDYGFTNGVGVEMIDGYEVVTNSNGEQANLIVMEHYAASPA